MAQGDVVVFDKFLEYVLKGNAENPFDFGATPDTIKCAIVNNATVPAATTADPCWGAGGTTNFATNEQTGGNFTAGGQTCASLTVTDNAGTIELDFGDPATWSQNAGNPTTCYWGIVYSDTATNKNCIAYVDLGGVFDATTGDLTITWGAPFATLNQA
ncbi:MAG: hypothetical protein JSW51_02610 [Gemmatimonadota bacterium]|nr:MAG: hypothetical protein JSW51_02610 [Gemmatimonadota bacterium]